MLIFLSLIAGCCGSAEDPVLVAPDNAWTDVDEVWELPLEAILLEHDRPIDELEVVVDSGEHLQVGLQDLDLYAIPEAGWTGREWISVSVTDRCERSAEIEFELGVGAMAGDCTTTLSYEAQGSPASVAVAGVFSDWEEVEMTDQGDGSWSVELDLAPGAWPYKIVEDGAWTCNPAADSMQCDEGYDQGTWSDCTLGANSCNSLLVVRDCDIPTVGLSLLDIDRGAGTADLRVVYTPGQEGQAIGSLEATLDGQSISQAEGWTGDAPLQISLSGLDAGRHTVRIELSDTAGREAEPLYVPFWTDDLDWDRGLLYYVFVDRFENGDPSLDASYGTTHPWTEYMGGDWQGVIDRMDYLQDLGVTAIWLTAPVDNAQGVWGEKCNATFTGYHGYWPSSATAPEEHFGDEALLRELIDEAHSRNIRVIVDWVGNHVHTDHPYYAAHPDWYNPERLCRDANNWNDIPETCWFDPFLPDIDYYQPEPLVQMVDDAVHMVKEYELDGYRVDAVKHMPHPVYYNLQSRIITEVEHSRVGGDEDFYTVGETFDGDRGLVGSYVNARELDAQFDFSLYFTLRSAFTDRGASLYDLQDSYDTSRDAFAGYTMSTFLGNHDVERFITVADVGGWGTCTGDGSDLWDPAQPPADEEPYLLLKLGWTWLFTHDGLPLVYYGDELGLPGHGDPDNRQMMRFDGELSAWEADVLDHVTALGQARLDHPQLAVGDGPVWWEEADLWIWARSSEHGGALVAINRSWSDRSVSNGLAWAGLPQGAYEDVLTGATYTSSGDNLSFTVPAMGSVVLVER